MKALKFLIPFILASLALCACTGTPNDPLPAATGNPPAHTPQTAATIGAAQQPIATPQTASPAESSASVAAARNALAAQLNIDPSSISLVSVEPVTWSDSCLGVPSGRACLEVLTPGYKITFEAGSRQYEVHTDAGGKAVIVVPAQPFSMVPTIIWQSPEQPCQMASIDPSGLSFGSCQSVLKIGQFANPDRVGQLNSFIAQYRSFVAETRAGSITFTGQGQVMASPAEDRAIAEWAMLVDMEAQAGRSEAGWGLAFSWSRQGGIAGFCDDLEVYLDGEVVASTCKGDQLNNGGKSFLTAGQLEQLYTWVDRFQSFEIDQSDQATADSMTVSLNFGGSGVNDPVQADRQSVLSFASEIFTNAGQ